MAAFNTAFRLSWDVKTLFDPDAAVTMACIACTEGRRTRAAVNAVEHGFRSTPAPGTARQS